MYVKVTMDVEHGDTFWQTEGPIDSGLYTVPFKDDGDGPIFDFQKGLPSVPLLLHIHEIDMDQQTEYERNKNIVAVHFATWPDPENVQSIGVVTTRNIFILGDNGKTIDRVR